MAKFHFLFFLSLTYMILSLKINQKYFSSKNFVMVQSFCKNFHYLFKQVILFDISIVIQHLNQ